MKTRKINGLQFERMLRNGMEHLRASEREINQLNVFPVPDGDTGTNMRLTLENGLRTAKSTAAMGAYLKSLSSGMLLGARGNSGVILSQIFKGIFLELCHCGSIGVLELRNALIRGYKTAYEAVVHPTEGTILTVTRQGIEHIKGHVDRNTTMETLLTMYLAEMRKSLRHTPELLPVLKEAGVVDSGAMGFILIVEGMLMCLDGQVLQTAQTEERPAPTEVSELDFHENSAFVDGYCMEFILQRMRDSRYDQHFRLNSYIEELESYGNSLVVIEDGMRVKVHIHTLKPAKIITTSQEYGEFLTFKMENMQVQHNEHDRRQAVKHKPLAVIAAVNGEGFANLFRELGCDWILDGGATMNISSEEFLEAYRSVSADRIVVLPNNKNSVLAAQQAAQVGGFSGVTVFPTQNLVEGYYAMASDLSDDPDVERRIHAMRSGMDSIDTLSVTTATRAYRYHAISCRAGDEIALLNGELVSVSDRWADAILGGLESIEDAALRDSCVIFRGKAVPQEREAELEALLSARYPGMELTFLPGGQEIYHWLMGIL